MVLLAVAVSPPGGGPGNQSDDHMTGIALSFTMDPVEVEAFSFLQQEITQQLILESRSSFPDRRCTSVRSVSRLNNF